MAPTRKPTKLKVLEGNPGHRPLNQAEPEPSPGWPDPPDDLTPVALALWERLGRDYAHTSVVTPVDAQTLAVYCEVWSRYTVASLALNRSGPLVKGRDGNTVRNPLHAIVRDLANQLRMYARELGFTPSARASPTDPRKGEKGDELDRWMQAK